MSKSNNRSRARWQGFALAGIIAGSVVSASTAFAGECPTGKMQERLLSESRAESLDRH